MESTEKAKFYLILNSLGALSAPEMFELIKALIKPVNESAPYTV